MSRRLAVPSPSLALAWLAAATGLALLLVAGAGLLGTAGPAAHAATPLRTSIPRPTISPAPPATAPQPTSTLPPAATPTTVAPAPTAAPAAPAPAPATLLSSPSHPAESVPNRPVDVVLRYAAGQLGRPYLLGAAGPRAFDCSGLTMAAYVHVGIHLPHLASAQARLGRAVDWHRHPIRPGDLVFVTGGHPRHSLGHVGIAISATQWISAPRPGAPVHVAPIPFASIERVRRYLPST